MNSTTATLIGSTLLLLLAGRAGAGEPATADATMQQAQIYPHRPGSGS